MSGTVTEKLIEQHLAGGEMTPGKQVLVHVDQTLTQDATGTLVMLALEALRLDTVRTELSAQYVDHNLLQEDARNPDDHVFLRSACRRFGVWLSGPGNGVSHPVHMQCFGAPGKTLLGSDSHTCAAGSLGMLAVGAGGLDVAMAMAGEAFSMTMPEIWGVKLTGELPPWVSAKDVILEMLRRHGVEGGVGKIVEYYGPGLEHLTAMDRHVIANMGAELGATTTVFPSDDQTERFLCHEGRGDVFRPLQKDDDAVYSMLEEIDLSCLEPLIALPSSPENVVPVREVAGRPIYQSYIGSSANPGFRDFAVAAGIVRDRTACPGVSFDVNPTSRQLLTQLGRDGSLETLIQAGARLHQAGCNGCIGMGQAPASGKNSLRTVPRNFPGRSGTKEDNVYLCSPETAAASALFGEITDPRELSKKLDLGPPKIPAPSRGLLAPHLLEQPPEGPDDVKEREKIFPLEKGANVSQMPKFEELPDTIEATVILEVGDDISTDEILPAGAKVLPYRSNIPEIAKFCFRPVDEDYVARAQASLDKGGHAIVAGRNYGQGSSREHAALAPRTLGLRIVLARSFARIHHDNLVNFGVVPLEISDTECGDAIGKGENLTVNGLHSTLKDPGQESIGIRVGNNRCSAGLRLSPRQREVLRAGGLVNWWKRRRR